jgi:acylphosphatase
MKKAVKVLIQGTVQGVFFRQFCKDEADKLSLKGIVRNMENGDVELVMEGDHENVDKMVELLKKGPQHAQIKNVLVEDRKWSGDFDEFKILRF